MFLQFFRIAGKKKTLPWLRTLFLTLLFAGFMSAGCSAQHTVTRAAIIVPTWAPPYTHVESVRYYFLPDIDVYYDVFSGEFVYWDGFEWVYTQDLPVIYEPYDLYTAYVVILNEHVVRPWRRNKIYVKHYPEHYYLTYYGPKTEPAENTDTRLRGFNENSKKPIYATVASKPSVPKDKTRVVHEAKPGVIVNGTRNAVKKNEPSNQMHREKTKSPKGNVQQHGTQSGKRRNIHVVGKPVHPSHHRRNGGG